MTEILPLGTIVEKVNSLPGDGHADGDRGRVCEPTRGIASHLAAFLKGNHYLGPTKEPMAEGSRIVPVGTVFYFIEWEDLPGVPVGITSDRIKKWSNT